MKLSAERLPEALPVFCPQVHRDVPAVLEVRDLRVPHARPDGSRPPVLDGVSFDVYAGEMMVLLGPSGSGKTTLLQSLAGLAAPERGTVKLDGRTVFSSRAGISVPAERRGLSIIQQAWGLRPDMTVFQNIACPPQAGSDRRPRKPWHAAQVAQMLAAMDLERLAKQYPGQLSGAQRQRVALSQALIGGAGLVLFDEPLADVDFRMREQLWIELLLLQHKLCFAAVFVTRNQREAMALGHSIAVLDRGKIAQHAAPGQLYHTPATMEVATLVGVTNRVGGVVIEAAGRDLVVNTAIGAIAARWPGDFVDDLVPLEEGDAATLMWRSVAGRLTQSEAGGPAPGRWAGVIERSWSAGSQTESLVRVGDERFRIRADNGAPLACGTKVCLELDPAQVLAYPDNTTLL